MLRFLAGSRPASLVFVFVDFGWFCDFGAALVFRRCDDCFDCLGNVFRWHFYVESSDHFLDLTCVLGVYHFAVAMWAIPVAWLIVAIALILVFPVVLSALVVVIVVAFVVVVVVPIVAVFAVGPAALPVGRF